MSTSAVYSPHQPTPNPLPQSSTTSENTLAKSRFLRGRSAGATPNGGSSSVSPTRPATSGSVYTRSRRSQTHSKESSPEKMSTTASEAPPPLAAPNGEAEIQPVPVASPVRLSEPDQTEPESNNNVNNTDDGVNHDTTTTTEIDDPVPIPDDPTTTVAAAKSQKIMLVIGRKRKADDEMTTVSSELHTPPSHPSKTPELDPTSDPSVTTLPPVAEAPGGKQVNDTSAIITEQPPLNLPTKGPERSSTPATTTPKAVELPKRAPRKRRKWLRKGEVDPEDLKAVAEQRARHALIDAALEDLDKQEQMLLDGVHPQLLALWEECDRRRDIQISYSQSHEEYEMGELDHLYLQELGQIRCQFKHDCEDLSTLMMFENRRAVGRLEAEKTFHDRGKPCTKRMYTNMPTLGQGRGSGKWAVHTNRLLSKGTRRKTVVRVGDHLRHRIDVPVVPRMATMKEAEHDLIRLGLREAPPLSSEDEESEEEDEEEEVEAEEDEPIIIDAPEVAIPSPPPIPQPVQLRARAPSPPIPVKDVKPAQPLARKPMPMRSGHPSLPPDRFDYFMPPHGSAPARPPLPPPPRQMDGPDGRPLIPRDPYYPQGRDRPPPLDPRPPPPLADPRAAPLDRPPPMDPRDRAPPPLNDRPPPLGDPRNLGRPPPHPYDRGVPPFDRGYPPPIDPHGRGPPMPPPPGSRVPPRYDDRGDWWGPRDRFGGPPGPGYGMPPPLMGPQTATAPPSNRPPPQPQTATPTGYWGGPPGPSDEWNDHHYYDRRFPPNNGPLPPPPTYATQRGP